jgi:hypothetical protein
MKNLKYICPMHPDVQSSRPGKCPICGMDLVNSADLPRTNWFQTYKPLIIIFSILFIATGLLAYRDMQSGNFTFRDVMFNFMSGFFLVFGSLKLLDLRGFANQYARYDFLAGIFKPYGYLYPFIELAFGFAYLFRYNEFWFHIGVAAVMAFSGAGVLYSMRKKRKFQCACLGTLFSVPLTKITLVEDFVMAFMALLMLVA